MTSSLLVRRLAVTVCLLGGWSLLSAQAVKGRILEEINPNNTAALAHSVNPRIAPQYRTGSMDPSTPIDGITIHFQPTAEQKAELDELVKAQQTPGSPEYHQWLTPAEYANQFGLSQSDMQKVETWLESEGFNVERVGNSRTSITFSGTVEQVENAFQTEMGKYQVNGREHWANATNLSIPAALSGIVQSVGNLNDFRPHPMTRPAIPNSAVARPAYTDAEFQYYFLTPDDVATIYDINPAYNSGYNGSGVTIAIMGQSAIEASDINHFQSAANLPEKDPTMILVPGTGASQTYSGDESESDLDVEYSGAIATGATIDFVYVGNNQNDSVFDSLEYAVDDDLAPVISISYGACESSMTQSQFQSLDDVLEQGALQGQSIIASAGDDGSTSCLGYTNLTTAQQEALEVNYPASSDYATALGGTEFPAGDVNYPNGTYWSSSNISGGGSALSYIPEEAWNDDPTCAPEAPREDEPAEALCSGGGGTSIYSARPSWQTGVTIAGVAIPSGTMRLVPDVSLDASNVDAPYLYCTSDTSAWSSGQKASCDDGFLDSATQDPTAAGGTSFSAPIFAGMLAIIDGYTHGDQGVAASELYKLASNSSTYAAAFHDIVAVGSDDGNQCTAGSTYCSSAGESEYPATTGYDEATGLGSVDFNALLTAWSGSAVTPLDATTTTVAAATATDNAGTADAITITVAPQSSTVTTTPTGTVTVSVNGTTATTPTLINGSATYSFTSTVNGSYTIEAAYSGDSTFASSVGTVTVTVTDGTAAASFALSASPTTMTATSGGSGSSAITATSQNSYAGTVDLELSTSSTVLEEYGCYGIANSSGAEIEGVTLTANGTAAATLTLYTSESACNSSAGSLRPGMRVFRLAGTTGGSARNRSPFGGAVPMGAAALGGLLLFGFRRRSKLGAMLGCLMLAVALGGFASGCGSSGGNLITTTTSSNVPAGSYALTLAGTDSVNTNLTTSINLTLTVN